MQKNDVIEKHPLLGEIKEWTYRGSEQNIWHGGDVGEGGNCWSFCTRDCSLDGSFTAAELRAIADYMDRVKQ